MSTRLRDLSLLLALLALAAFFTLKVPAFGFISPRNLSLLTIDFSITAILAVGMLLVILPGHIDLSAGSGVGLIGGIAAVLITRHDWPAPVAMLLGIAAALVLWLAMGTLIVRQRIPAFIITLGGLLVFKGLFWLIIDNHTIPIVPGGQSNLYSLLTTYYLPPLAGWLLAALLIAALLWRGVKIIRSASHTSGPDPSSPDRHPDTLRIAAPRPAAPPLEPALLRLFIAAQLILLFTVLTSRYRGIPLPALLLAAVATAAYVLTRYTPFGRYLYAIGGSEEAALISGIPIQRITICAFGCMGAIVALTGYLQTAYAGASTTTTGDLMELDAVAACVIGGVSLKGGRGSVLGVLAGALIMATLLNGMTLLAVEPEKKYIARGLVLILAVWMDVRAGRK